LENTGDYEQYVDRVSTIFNLAFHTFKKRYIANGGSMNDTRLLHAAAFSGNTNLVKIVIEAGADINGYNGFTPLTIATWNNWTETVLVLVEQGANAEVPDSFGWTSLMMAAFKGFNQIVKILLESNVDVDKTSNETGACALHLAAQENHREIVSLLLDHNAYMDIQKNNGFTPLLHSAELEFFEISKLLIDKGASFNGSQLLYYAFFSGNVILVKMVIKLDMDINEKTNGNTPLTIATLKNRTEAVSLLLEHRANAELTDIVGRTPLIQAVAWGFTQIVKILLESNVDIDKTSNETGSGALHQAVWKNNTEIWDIVPTWWESACPFSYM
jgi:ankyrin repeat protein